MVQTGNRTPAITPLSVYLFSKIFPSLTMPCGQGCDSRRSTKRRCGLTELYLQDLAAQEKQITTVEEWEVKKFFQILQTTEFC